MSEMTAQQREVAAKNIQCFEHVQASVDASHTLGLDPEATAMCMFALGMQLLIRAHGEAKAMDVFRGLFKSASRPKRKTIRQ